MISYRSMAGGEVLYWNGILHFWTFRGVYTVKAVTLHKHGQYKGPREVLFDIEDLNSGFRADITMEYPDSFDDYEIINRWISGTSSCDCVRGQILYGTTLDFQCNNGGNRFILHEMTIRGDASDCVLTYRGYI